jgi:SOS-response transcriptional repressor LexA
MTPRQYELLTYFRDYFVHFGKNPTFTEMKKHMQVKSNQTIEDWLLILENNGYILRDSNKRGCIILSDKVGSNSNYKKFEKQNKLNSSPILILTNTHSGSSAVTNTYGSETKNNQIIFINEFNKEGT